MVFETSMNINFDRYADGNTPYTYSSKVENKICLSIYKGH